MKISGDSIIYKIGFSQTKSESHRQVRTHMKMRDHIMICKFSNNFVPKNTLSKLKYIQKKGLEKLSS